ncbi:MAG: hypothetical protein LBC88_06180 [Spirochaetaceae bacterium]|jgi:predicted NUDIX family phosphoesterase|nr:hypothetical protein [Spirochaetaceae bacterium]
MGDMEEVLVIPRSLLRAREDGESLIAAIREAGRFLPRDSVENDPSYKQIIPYVFARQGGFWFVLRRLATQSEKRLHGRLSLGIGGHINPVDRTGGEDPVRAGLRRELAEEVSLDAAGEPVFRGVINDESSPVGQVHLGLVFELACASSSFEIREKDKMEGAWADRASIAARYGAFESWSQMVFNRYIRTRQDL